MDLDDEDEQKEEEVKEVVKIDAGGLKNMLKMATKATVKTEKHN